MPAGQSLIIHAIRKNELLDAQTYLDLERASERKHEFVNGAIYAMGGATDRHNLVAGNIFAALHAHRPTGCQVFLADMKLRIRVASSELFYYPDVLVSCSAQDRAPLYREQPVLLVEVLSPTTERIDRGEKLNAYCQIATLVEYVLVDPDTGAIEVYRRGERWARNAPAPQDVLDLESMSLSLTSAQIFRDVEFA